jgi:hypothetical protein
MGLLFGLFLANNRGNNLLTNNNWEAAVLSVANAIKGYVGIQLSFTLTSDTLTCKRYKALSSKLLGQKKVLGVRLEQFFYTFVNNSATYTIHIEIL